MIDEQTLELASDSVGDLKKKKKLFISGFLKASLRGALWLFYALTCDGWPDGRNLKVQAGCSVSRGFWVLDEQNSSFVF